MNKQIVLLLLASLPLANTYGVVNYLGEYETTAKDFKIKGPIKTYRTMSGYSQIELNFNDKGGLTEGKSANSKCTVEYDANGNLSKKVYYDYKLSTCDCDAVIERTEKEFAKAKKEGYELVSPVTIEGDPYWKCKNHPEYVKAQVKFTSTYTYDINNRLIKCVESKAESNYRDDVTCYKYDELGNKIEQTNYYANTLKNKAVITWIYNNGLLVRDMYDKFVYNDKGQLIEKRALNNTKEKTIFTYHDNGKLKASIRIGKQSDTIVVCNSNGDTLKYYSSGGKQYRNPEGEVEFKIKYVNYKSIVFDYDKNSKTSKKYVGNDGKVHWEEVFDNTGKVVKIIFDNGYIERLYDNQNKTFTENIYLKDKQISSSTFDMNNVCLCKISFDDNGVENKRITKEVDKYGNVTKVEETEGYRKKTSTYLYTYYE